MQLTDKKGPQAAQKSIQPVAQCHHNIQKGLPPIKPSTPNSKAETLNPDIRFLCRQTIHLSKR